MALVKFGHAGLQEPRSIEELNEKIRRLERDLQYILTHLYKQNFTQEFAKKNNMK